MKQFEYIVDQVWEDNLFDVRDKLDEWGFKGWECFYIEINNNSDKKYRTLFLKKEIEK